MVPPLTVDAVRSEGKIDEGNDELVDLLIDPPVSLDGGSGRRSRTGIGGS